MDTWILDNVLARLVAAEKVRDEHRERPVLNRGGFRALAPLVKDLLSIFL